MVQFPGPALQRIGGRRLVEGVVQPAMPLGRHLGSLGVAAVDHPAALMSVVAAEGVAPLVVLVAVLVIADEHAMARHGEADADGGAVPPGEDRFQHGGSARRSRWLL